MTPDKVEAALGVLRSEIAYHQQNVDAAKTFARLNRWPSSALEKFERAEIVLPALTESLATLTSALAERESKIIRAKDLLICQLRLARCDEEYIEKQMNIIENGADHAR